MDKDEIIEMAFKAGVEDSNEYNHLVCTEVELVAFAELVAAKERKACAREADWCIQNHLEQHIPERIRARDGTPLRGEAS